MKPDTMCTSPRRAFAMLAFQLVLAPPALASEKPAPTPKPGTLGAYAQSVKLDRSALKSTPRVVLTNSDVADIARGAAITLGSVSPSAIATPGTSNRPSDRERERWTRAHHKQELVIAGLKKKRSLLEIDVANLDGQRPTPKLLARLDRARAELRYIETRIIHEKQILARIVRRARQHGAQPDWFR